MRLIIALYLLYILTACVVQPGLNDEHAQPPIIFKEPLAQPTAATTLASSVLLARWNESRRRHEIGPVDPNTGREIPGYPPIALGDDIRFAPTQILSSDGRKLAAVESHGQSCESYAGGVSCRPRADLLHLVDLLKWREITASLPVEGWLWPFVFSPDTSRLALIHHTPKTDTLMLLNTATGEFVARRPLSFRPSLLAYTQAGAALLLYGQPPGSEPGISKPGPSQVLLVDAATLEPQWKKTLPQIISGDWCLQNCQAPHAERLFANWMPAVVVAPDQRKLYIVHADEDKLTTVDLEARAVRSDDLQAAQLPSWFERLLEFTAGVVQAKGAFNGAVKAAVLSPDGTKLYLAGHTTNSSRDTNGNWRFKQISLGLQVIDIAAGRKIAGRDSALSSDGAPSEDEAATKIGLTPDGTYLWLAGRNEQGAWTQVVDANSLEPVARLTQWDIAVSRRLNGQPIIVASWSRQQQTQLAVLDPHTFDIGYSWPVDGFAWWVAAP